MVDHENADAQPSLWTSSPKSLKSKVSHLTWSHIELSATRPSVWRSFVCSRSNKVSGSGQWCGCSSVAPVLPCALWCCALCLPQYCPVSHGPEKVLPHPASPPPPPPPCYFFLYPFTLYSPLIKAVLLSLPCNSPQRFSRPTFLSGPTPAREANGTRRLCRFGNVDGTSALEPHHHHFTLNHSIFLLSTSD